MKASDNVFPKLLLSNGATVPNPDAGNIALYADPSGNLFTKNSAGASSPVGGGGSSEAVTSVSISGGNAVVDCAMGANKDFILAMTSNATLSVSNLAAAGRVTEFECLITQDATGSRTLTLPASFRPLGGSDTAIAAAAGAKTVLSAKTFDAGATWVYAMQEVG